MKLTKKIIIVNSYYYYGGTLVLSELCRCLSKLGYDARLLLLHNFPLSNSDILVFSRIRLLFTNVKLCIARLLNHFFPKLRFDEKFFPEYFHAIHLKNCPLQINPFFFNKRTVVLYPEVIYGNPLKAKKVVRWLLYFYHYGYDKKAYSKNDLFICYREIFNNDILNSANRKVTIGHFDSQLYKQTNFAKRNGKCYIVRKGRNRKDLPQTFDGPVIDDLSEIEKVKILNQCEYCYSYDTQTFYCNIASICGCKTIIVMEPGKKREDYLGYDEKRPYGIAYGDSKEEIKWAIQTREKLANSLNYEESNKKNVLQLIKYINDHFGT